MANSISVEGVHAAYGAVRVLEEDPCFNAGRGSVLDADRVLGLAELLRDGDPVQRIPDRDRNADQAMQLVGEARQMRRPAGQHELTDPERSGLVLVEAQARDALARDWNRAAIAARSERFSAAAAAARVEAVYDEVLA